MQRPASLTSSLHSLHSLHTARGRGGGRGRAHSSRPAPWYSRPLLSSAGYTDLTRGAWHAASYSTLLACWTAVTAVFDVYCLEEAAPGASHTGVYWLSYDFVYVGNHHVRNLLVLTGLLSVTVSLALFVSSCLLLTGLRHENQQMFRPWLYTMAIFTVYKLLHCCYGAVVNDLIFGYHAFTFLLWLALSVANGWALAVVYSLYLELVSLGRLEDMTRQKLDTLSSRGGSVYGSRVGTLDWRGTPHPTAAQLYPASPRSVYSDLGSVYSLPGQGGGDTTVYGAQFPGQENLYASLQRPGNTGQWDAQEQVYATVIN